MYKGRGSQSFGRVIPPRLKYYLNYSSNALSEI